MPHSRFWMATAPENTSRPQCPETDNGVRNCPSAERGPKLSRAIRQPHPTTNVGVRQPAQLASGLDIDATPARKAAQRPAVRINRAQGGVSQTKLPDASDL